MICRCYTVLQTKSLWIPRGTGPEYLYSITINYDQSFVKYPMRLFMVTHSDAKYFAKYNATLNYVQYNFTMLQC